MAMARTIRRSKWRTTNNLVKNAQSYCATTKDAPTRERKEDIVADITLKKRRADTRGVTILPWTETFASGTAQGLKIIAETRGVLIKASMEDYACGTELRTPTRLAVLMGAPTRSSGVESA